MRMHLKHSVLFIFIQFTEIIYCLTINDVCSADDDTCKKPNLPGVGKIEKGKCSLTGVLLRFRQLSLLECAKECFITSNCTSINYRQNWKLCDLVMSNAIGNEIADDSTCIKSNITTWEKFQSLAGKCAYHNCEEGQKCKINANNNRFKCVEAYCKGLPNTPHAELQEPFGLRRNLDTGNKYKCNNGYNMEGKPFAVCKSPGHWKVLFNCTTKAACSAEGYKYDMNTTTCIKLVKADKSYWDNAKETCQQQPGGDLVSITTKEKWYYVIEYLKAADIGSEKVWIGLKDKHWMNGVDFTKLDGIFGSLSSANANKPCGMIKQSELDYHKCQHNNMFLCEILIA
ncbi:uncharacterized protein LOC127721943 [Mytilus californianus]|uniref:uncharacterized protein LOC127721943 n=1 Tax=Mytilus californianus TaxID=6549 RepID=UPI0022483B18|nr:uncharacterized protein LOC127721943 [Mytilus californianus]